MFQNKFLKNNIVFMTGTFLSGLLGYAFHFTVSRQISVAQYGELQSLLSAFIIFGVFNSAFSYFIIRHTSVFATQDDRESLRGFVDYLSPKISKFTSLFLLVLIVLSPLMASILHFSSYLGFVVVSFATFFSTMTIIHYEILRGWQKFFLLSFTGVIITLVKLASGAGLAHLSPKASTVSLALFFSAFVGWLLAKNLSKKNILENQKNHSQSDWKGKYFPEDSVRKSAANIFAFSLALILVSNLDMILVKYFSSAEIAGHYGAFSLLGKIILWLNLATTSVILPEACSNGYSGKRPDKKNLLQSYGLMFLIGCLAILAYYLIPNFIINFIFGKKYILSNQTLWLFGLMSFLLSLLTFEANLSFAKHDFRIIYFLTATLLLMISGIAKYHASLTQIALVFSISFLVSYIMVTALNLTSKK